MTIKVTHHCDLCGKEVSSEEYRDQILFGKSATNELDVGGFILLCHECALYADYEMAKLKFDMKKGSN